MKPTPQRIEDLLISQPDDSLESCIGDEFSAHPLIAGKYFYTVPVTLLERVINDIGNERFDPALIDLEMSLSAPLGDHSTTVGYWQNSPVIFNGFKSLGWPSESETVKGPLPMDVHIQTNSYQFYYRYLNYPSLQRDYKSYAGWLLTNAQFLDEHDRLFSRNLDIIRQLGVECDLSDPFKNDPASKIYFRERAEFLCRWRLSGLPGPYLPVPLGCDIGAKPPEFPLFQLWEIGAIFFMPDIMPLPSREQLRLSIQDIRQRTHHAEHLIEWFKIARSGNSAKNQLDRFARIFELQHYWRVLHSRHRNALSDGLLKLEIVFAVWFGVSEQTIHQDRLKIMGRLGRDWASRCSPI